MAIDVLNDRVKELQVHNEQLEIMLRNSQAKVCLCVNVYIDMWI